jgi:hypothetical protein
MCRLFRSRAPPSPSVTSPEFVTRAAASSHRSAVSPPQPSYPTAPPPCALHVDAFRASNHAPEPEFEIIGESRCRSPPDLDPTCQLQSRRPHCLQMASTVRPRSNGSDQPSPESTRSNPVGSGVFAEKSLGFPVFTKIPFHLRKFLTD